MSESIKLTEEEITKIASIQTEYQTLGIQLVQSKLAITNAKSFLEGLIKQEEELSSAVIKVSENEKSIALELETKYGKGEIDMATGLFTATK